MRVITEAWRKIRREPSPQDIALWKQAKDHLEQSGATHHLISEAQELIEGQDHSTVVYESTPSSENPNYSQQLRFELNMPSNEDYDLYLDPPPQSFWISKGVQVVAMPEGIISVDLVSIKRGGKWTTLSEVLGKSISPQFSIGEQIRIARKNATGYMDDLRYGKGLEGLRQIEREIKGLRKIF